MSKKSLFNIDPDDYERWKRNPETYVPSKEQEDYEPTIYMSQAQWDSMYDTLVMEPIREKRNQELTAYFNKRIRGLCIE